MPIPSHIPYSIVSLTSLLKRDMEGNKQITVELFVSVDKACHALDELKLPEGYHSTIKRQKRVSNSKDSESSESAMLMQRCPEQTIRK